MACAVPISTEDKIKTAAIKMFLEKGFEGTTTRDIANEAGLNCALMNYYFRSKEKLFSNVFNELFEVFFQGLSQIFNQPISLKEKLIKMIDHDFDMLQAQPDLANFIFTEIHRNPERLEQISEKMKSFQNTLFQKQLESAVKNGEIVNIDFKHILLLIKSNTQFMFHSKPLTATMWNLDDAGFSEFADKHRDIAKDMIISYLFK